MKAPHFWSSGLDPKSREAAPLTRALLTPLSKLYTWGVRRKLRRAISTKVSAKVICVGNVTVGGVGKTPIVKAVRDFLSNKGPRVATLSRGYGGTEKGPLKIDPTQHTSADVGDEPMMLSTSGESWVGQDRAQTAKAMVADGVDIIVMDDGMQNPSLIKDLTLLVIDAAAPFGNGYVLPKGPLREPVSDGLDRCDLVILMGNADTYEISEKLGKPILRASLKPDNRIPDGPLIAFAGIGRPEKFFDTIKSAGGNLAEGVSYGDHYVYTPSDLKFLRALAKTHDARLITTTKDAARLPVDQRTDILTLPVTAEFEDMTALEAILAPILQSPDNG